MDYLRSVKSVSEQLINSTFSLNHKPFPSFITIHFSTKIIPQNKKEKRKNPLPSLLSGGSYGDEMYWKKKVSIVKEKKHIKN